MGQYQKWLHYQEIDRHLRAQLETLEAELAQQQSRLHILEQEEGQLAPLPDNPVIQALAAQLQGNNMSPESTTGHAGDTGLTQFGAFISPALSSWGELPIFGPQEIDDPAHDVENSLPSVSHPEIELLPEDMMAFFDGNAQTEPQLELPWWLRKIAISTNNAPGTRPIDQETIRTNRLVQRWIERWGRQSSTTLKIAENKEENSHE
jgi:hypothetical protein